MPQSRSLAELIGGHRSEREEEITSGIRRIEKPEVAKPIATPEAGQVAAKAAPAEQDDGDSKVLEMIVGAIAGCWVAAEYYPMGSDDWFRCRNWVLERPRLTKVYIKHGERFARFLNRHPVAHWLFRPVVEHAHRRGEL
jgi:hypothetical protein